MKRRRRSLDMLPLLDVFMVILFVFATVQEGQVEVERAEASTEVEAAKLAVQAAEEKAQEAARARTRAEARRRRAEARHAQLAAARDGGDEPRRDEVLERLLEKTSVVEIELAGRVADDGDLEHACCFRTDPRASFASCGRLPTVDQLGPWLSADGAPLAAALRKHAGSVSLALVRQDHVAAYRLAARIAEALRGIFPDRRFSAEPPGALPPMCTFSP